MARKSTSATEGAVAVAPRPEPAVSALDTLGLAAFEEDAAPRMDLEQMLLFRLDTEWYAVAVGRVREVLNGCAVSPVPCVPDYVLGVTSLRGEIVSVTDLGRLMGIGGFDGGLAKLPAIVLENHECATTLPVDELGELVCVALGEVEAPVRTAERSRTSYVAGCVEIGGTITSVLDADRVLSPIGEKPSGSADSSRKVVS